MNRQHRFSIAAAALLLCAAGSVRADTGRVCRDTTPAAAPAMDRLATARIPFIRNRGQIAHPEVSLYARTFAGTVFVTRRSELVYALPHTTNDGDHANFAFRESFVGGRPAIPVGEGHSAIRVSHFKGADPDRWKSHLETFDRVNLGELYPGVQVALHATGRNIEKVFRIAPGGDVEAIEVAIEGIDRLAIDSQRQLVLDSTHGDVVFTAPIAYQKVNGRRRAVEVAYKINGDDRYGFAVGSYDSSHELVIDPMLASTYLGGHNPQPPGNYDDDIIYAMAAVDGDIYVAGATQSPDFPVHMGYDVTLDSAWPDGFIARMSGDLSMVIAATFIGTEGSDRVTHMAVDDDGTVIVVGQGGYGFPVTDGAYTWNGTTPTGGGFVARFSADLSSLVASAVVTPSDYAWRVALGNGSIYFGGSTNNPEFPITPGAYLSTCCPAGPFGIRESDGFAGRISPDLSTLEAMTYLGGETVSGISVAPDGTVYLTDGWDYAITGYLARFDGALTTRNAYLSYYPGSTSGSSRTYFNDVAAGDGFVVTAGQTYMNDLPATEGAFDTTCGTDGVCDGVGSLLVPRSDGFVAIYSADLEETIALTYLGGSYHEAIRALALAPEGDIYLVGETASVDFPTAGIGPDSGCGTDGQCDPTGPYDSPTADGFVARMSADLARLDYGSYLGGSSEDRPLVVAVDDAGIVYTAGYTRSADFPTTPGAFDQSANGGTSDAFISSFEASPEAETTIFSDGLESGTMSGWSAEHH